MATIAKLPRTKQPDAGTVQWYRDCVERGKSGVFSEAVTVTPGLAQVILDTCNPNNRPVKWKVSLYAADMIAGRWMFNGEPLLVSEDGLLNDGQHRLLAINEANTPQKMLFVFGLSRESRMTVDQGSARGAGDYIGMGGVKNANHMASIAKAVIGYETGDGVRLAIRDITNGQIVARANTDTSIAAACDYAVSVYRHTKPFAAPQVIGAAYYILDDIDAADAREYMDAVCLGEGLKRKDPAYAVREALMNAGRTSIQAKLEILFRGWNAYRAGRELKMAKVMGNLPALA